MPKCEKNEFWNTQYFYYLLGGFWEERELYDGRIWTLQDEECLFLQKQPLANSYISHIFCFPQNIVNSTNCFDHKTINYSHILNKHDACSAVEVIVMIVINHYYYLMFSCHLS